MQTRQDLSRRRPIASLDQPDLGVTCASKAHSVPPVSAAMTDRRLTVSGRGGIRSNDNAQRAGTKRFRPAADEWPYGRLTG